MKVWQLVVVGILVHVILFYSIFDIYFTSPLVHGMTPRAVPTPAPASRLILFVADGLRADKFFEPDEYGKSRVPYLRKVIEEEGVWGVSHTRVPTESRPGHVALIAGFYEDVSAVAKGWKENPVDFDSVFNQSRHTWSWGSPDILPMFAKGASGDHVITNCYPADLEDFAGSDMTRLDTWVFDQVKEFFGSASNNLTLNKELRQDKIVMFLHLLGIDTHGHSSKPHSREYLNNIQVVDRGIKDTVKLVNKFYKNDGRTVFLLTADHGMTDWGSHGAGHPQETLTPFLAWGPGVRKPLVQEHCGNFADTFCTDWHLDFLRRCDMEQADIAPLMSYLIGTPLPVNSVGILPTDVLNASDSMKAEALLVNAQQLLAQFDVKMTQIKDRTLVITFRPYQELEEGKKERALKHIRHLIHSGMPQDAILEAHKLIKQALDGLRYYQTYDRLFLGVSIVMGFLGWMSYILHLVVAEYTSLGRQAFSVSSAGTASSQRFSESMESVSLLSFEGTIVSRGLLVAVCSAIVLLLYVQSLPLMYYVYCLSPALLWFKSLQGWSVLSPAIRSKLFNSSFPWSLLLSCFCCLAGLEIAVQSFYRRELLSLGLLAMSVWPLVSLVAKSSRSRQPDMTFTFTKCGWSLACLIVAVFPILPVVGRNSNYDLVFASGILAFLGGVIIVSRVIKVSASFSLRVLSFQLLLVLTSVIVVAVTSWSISHKLGLPFLCQLISWTTLGASTILPLLTGTGVEERLLSLDLAFFSTFLLMSITYEGFFFLSLLALLYFWMRIEMEMSPLEEQKSLSEVNLVQAMSTEVKDHRQESRLMQMSDLRRALFYVFFIIVAFFGTGNIASINSFDPSSVYCFLTVFNPFVMGALMMLKNILPFLVVTCALRAVHVCTQTPLRALFLLVLVMSDFMGLHFFFLVRDHGSWLEIGTTISHYVIVMAMIIFLMLLTGVSHALTCWTISYTSAQHKRQKPIKHVYC